MAELSCIRKLCRVRVVTIAVMMFASIFETFLGALRAIVAVKDVVFPTIARALFYLNIAPETGKALGTNAVHQILVAAEILQNAAKSERVALRIYEGILGLIYMLAIIFEPMLALASVLALQRTVLRLGSIIIGNVIFTMLPVEALCALTFLIDVSGPGVR